MCCAVVKAFKRRLAYSVIDLQFSVILLFNVNALEYKAILNLKFKSVAIATVCMHWYVFLSDESLFILI